MVFRKEQMVIYGHKLGHLLHCRNAPRLSKAHMYP